MGVLSNKVAVITGGNRGIGRGITEKLLAAGAQVLLAQRQSPDWIDTTSGPARFVAVDLRDRDAPARIDAACAEWFPTVDILVNNAGIMFQAVPDELTESAWDDLMAINLRAPMFLSKALLPRLRAAGGGSIINIGSIEGLAANPGHAAYCASKAGIHGLTKAMAVDLGRYHIRCNALAPGWIDSDLSDAYLNEQADPAAALAALQAMHPVGRTGLPQDIGDAAVFLASDAAAFITGQVLVVDGGRTAKLPLPF